MNKAQHLLGSFKRWHKSGKAGPNAAHAVHWSWEIFGGHLSAGWSAMHNHGSLCVVTDALRVGGDDASYYNSLDPRNDNNTWYAVRGEKGECMLMGYK